LETLYKNHAKDGNLQGLILLTDGAHNGRLDPAGVKALAAKWRDELEGPLHPFGLGDERNTSGGKDKKDVAFAPDSIFADPSPVPVKGKLTVTAKIDAHSLAGVNVVLRLKIDGEEKVTKTEKLWNPTKNEVQIVCDAPGVPGEKKITLEFDPPPGDE